MPQLTRLIPPSLALCVGLAGCTPVIDTWREASGIAANDPDPVNAPFTQNLADAEAAPYPNLASVPPPPTRATTAAERQKLTQSLVADRAATLAAADGAPLGAGPVPRPAAAAAGEATPRRAGRASGAAAPDARTAAADPAGAARPAPLDASAAPATNPRDSALQMPELRRALPEPETARAAPPPPGLAPVARPAPAGLPPAVLASAVPQPPPPLPDMSPTSPSPMVGKERPRPAAPTMVAVLRGAAAPDRAEIARVAALFQEQPAQKQPGHVRVVGYAAAGGAGSEALAHYQAALDRAQAVAKALADAGIPGGRIQTEATPAGAGGGADGGVEIQFAP